MRRALMLLLTLTGCTWHEQLQPQPALTTPERIAYPAMVYNDVEDYGIRACPDAVCLRLWPEGTFRVEDRFRVLAADGQRYRIRNYRLAQETPSLAGRVFGGTFYSTLHFRMAFDLQPDGWLPPRLAWSILYIHWDDLRRRKVDENTPLPRLFAALMRP